MKFDENSDEIIFRYVPAIEWTLAVIFVLGYSGIFYFLFANHVIEIDWLNILFLIAGFLMFLAPDFISSKFLAPLTIVVINRKNSFIDISERRFYGRKFQKYYFHQIKKFKSHRAKLLFSTKYFLSLVLVNRKEVKLRIVIGEDKNETVKYIKNLNKYIKFKNLQRETPDKL